MIHKISQFCDKIDSLKVMSDRLRKMKYETPKSTDAEINAQIESIQSECLLVANDKGKYEKQVNVLALFFYKPSKINAFFMLDNKEQR